MLFFYSDLCLIIACNLSLTPPPFFVNVRILDMLCVLFSFITSLVVTESELWNLIGNEVCHHGLLAVVFGYYETSEYLYSCDYADNA